MHRKRIKKSIWLPLALALYGGAMSAYFGPRLIAEGLVAKFWLSIIVEVLVVIGLFFALRRKEKLASGWGETSSE